MAKKPFILKFAHTQSPGYKWMVAPGPISWLIWGIFSGISDMKIEKGINPVQINPFSGLILWIMLLS